MSDASVNEVYGKEEQKVKARVRLGKWRVLTLKRPSDFLLPFCLRRIWHLSRLRFCALHLTNANIDERGEREDRGCFSSSLRIGKRGTGATLPPPNSRAEQMARARDARVTVCVCQISNLCCAFKILRGPKRGAAELCRSSYSFHLGIVSQMQETCFFASSQCSWAVAAVIVSLGMPDLSFTGRGKKRGALAPLGHFSKNFLQKCHTSNIGRKQEGTKGRTRRANERRPTLSLSLS